jgi:hypothetical protein
MQSVALEIAFIAVASIRLGRTGIYSMKPGLGANFPGWPRGVAQ